MRKRSPALRICVYLCPSVVVRFKGVPGATMAMARLGLSPVSLLWLPRLLRRRKLANIASEMRHSSHRALRQRLLSYGNLLALWLCLGPVAGGFAVETTVLQDVVLRNWDLDDGRPSARINAVARTSDGYLWLATQKGLVRFDGSHFVVFDTSNTPGMGDDRASCLIAGASCGPAPRVELC